MTLRHRWLVLVLALAVAGSAFGQSSTTATLRGKIVNAQGNSVANAEINAVETATGFVHTVNSRADGSYTLGGLTPGLYNIVVAAPGYEPKSQDLIVQVGQTLDLDIRMTPTATLSESITVVGNLAVETKTSEIATNVTPQQIESLPQPERNFLNFAALAPGVRLSDDPNRKTFSGDAQPAEATNVFIDGVSTKNDVLQGGTSGQDSSRGNPFPQSAVQEFRVITQNYSAQYDKASSAIITAVTKSGSNTLDGNAFIYWQPRHWVAPLPKGTNFSTLATNNEYRRYQPGLSVGGPLIKDQLNFFLAYEGDQQHATTPVTLNNPAQNSARFGQYVGIFPSPFRSTLGFGKLSWAAAKNQIVDFSGSYRHEHEVRDFGGTTSYQSATDLRNWVYTSILKHQWNNSTSLNEASLSWSKYGWNPTPLNPDLVALNYEGAIHIGGRSDQQRFEQRRIELRDNYNFAPLKFYGDHNFQVGGNFDAMHYRVEKRQNGNPEFSFRIDPANGLTYDQPYQVRYGFGNPLLSTNNNEYGIYGQDHWTFNKNLDLNLGLRWDYESHMLDENYVTPANIVAGLTGKFTPPGGVSSTDYFSNGSQRKPYKSEFQPRLGFSYDIKGDGKSVVFGGWGKYYDRLFLNITLDERYRLQFPVYNIQFSPTGAPRGGGATVKWDPSYLTLAGLNALIAQGTTHPEIFLMFNGTKPPYSNQWNIGFRQAFGTWLGSASYNQVRAYRGFTWLSASGLCCAAIVPGFGNVLISDPNGKRYWYDGIYLSVDRPYTSQTRWGVHVAWTHGKAQQNGNDAFSLDYPSAADYPKHIVQDTQRDLIVGTGILGLPWEIKGSTIVTLGSGPATPFLDFSQGFSLANRQATNAWGATIYPPKSGGFGYRKVDFRLEKAFRAFGPTSVSVIGEVFNAFNFKNYGCLNNFLGPGDNRANIGIPNCVVTLGRREQLGLKVGF
jgi:carboxypeptidase family protein/TonB-dependent receptor-like protein